MESLEDAIAQTEYALTLFGEHLSSLDHAIAFLNDLKQEVAEGTDTETINLYLYGALSRLTDAKRDLYADVSMIKSKFQYLVNQSRPNIVSDECPDF